MLVLILGGSAVLSGVGFIGYGTYRFVVSSVWPDERGVDAEEVGSQRHGRPKEVCGCTKHHIRFRRDKYERHREHAQRLNNHKLLTDNLVHSSRSIVQVKDGVGYRVDRHKLTHSEPYLHKDAYRVLQDMGHSFADRVKGTRAEGSTFHISSLTRTVEQQEKLRRSPSGRNASPNVSAHSYGASFDIYRLGNTDSCEEARMAFEAVLKEFQKKGSILLCPEGNCIHVTVRGYPG